jgi:NADH dehydrogenase/NADH:ubiquinone oxidoreductase subunit G
MSELVDLRINGIDFQFPKGSNLLDAAESVGIHIPNLCHLRDLKGIGACRLCVVENNGKTIAACTTKIKKNMDVITDNERLRSMRETTIDLILSMHPTDCMTCGKAGVCRLQKYACDLGIKTSSFTPKHVNHPRLEYTPFIRYSQKYCILCSRCVRICQEQGTNVLNIMGRGLESRVTTADEQSFEESGCLFCGSCVDVCPVNAISEAGIADGIIRQWEYHKTKTTCLSCTSACAMVTSSFNGEIVKINSDIEARSSEQYLCKEGRFGFRELKSDARILAPMVRKNGIFVKTDWDEALAVVTEKLSETKSRKKVVSCGRLTNEDALSAGRLISDLDNCDFALTGEFFHGPSWPEDKKPDIEQSDLILIAGLDPSQKENRLPGVDVLIRKKINRNTRLIVIHTTEISLSILAAVSLHGDISSNLRQFSNSLKLYESVETKHSGHIDSSKENQIALGVKLFLESDKPLIFVPPSLMEAAKGIFHKKSTIVCLTDNVNEIGIKMAGLKPTESNPIPEATDCDGLVYVVGDVPSSRAIKQII